MAKFSFKREPPKEVVNFFKNKGDKPSFHWQDVWQEEHAINFTVAKATEHDVRQSIREALLKAHREGIPFDQFKRDLKPNLQKLGWWGQKEMMDPLTGEIIQAKLGSPRRLRTIYDANMRTARSAGQWDRAQRTKKGLPYFIYELGPASEHRPEHAAWSGLILPVDHSFWDTHMPPNGWGCVCRVRQITRAEAGRLGGENKAPDIKHVEFRNKRTGEVANIPEGIDPGWASNPGKIRMHNVDNFLAGKLDGASQGAARTAVADIVDSFRFEGIFKNGSKGYVPVGVLPKERLSELGAKSRVVRFSDYTADKGGQKHPDLKQEDYKLVQWLMEFGKCVEDKASHLTFVGQQHGAHWKATVKKTQNGKELYLQTLHKIQPDQAERILKRKK
ncbi:MAG: hypothetical protein BA863_08970 [Desulfovibrio sp. S3730MH75]|nr:MAG: hypothetical protein BA863_08970 [Desulfovibrio sp. S3730MH75]